MGKIVAQYEISPPVGGLRCVFHEDFSYCILDFNSHVFNKFSFSSSLLFFYETSVAVVPE